MFLIIFNMTVYVVDSLHIYNMGGYEGDPKYNPTGTAALTDEGNAFYKQVFVWFLEGALFTIATATIYTALTKSASDAGVAYSFLSGVFWPAALSALGVLQNIGGRNLGSSMIVLIFTILLIFIWGAGLLQMVRGGWKTYE